MFTNNTDCKNCIHSDVCSIKGSYNETVEKFSNKYKEINDAKDLICIDIGCRKYCTYVPKIR